MEKPNICPIDYVVDLISGKWKVLIIWHLKLSKKDLASYKGTLMESVKKC